VSGNGNGRALFRTIAVSLTAVLMAWMAWVTANVQNYVSGEKRGERLSTVEAQLMIEHSERKLWRECNETFAKKRP